MKKKIILASTLCLGLFSTYVVNADDVDFVPVNSDSNADSGVNFVKVNSDQMGYDESFDSVYNNAEVDGINSEKPLPQNKPVQSAPAQPVRQTVEPVYQSRQVSTTQQANVETPSVQTVSYEQSEPTQMTSNEASTSEVAEPVTKTEASSTQEEQAQKPFGNLKKLDNLKKPIGKLTKLNNELPSTAIMSTKHGLVASVVLLTGGLVSLLYSFFRKYMG
jgi:hypothetical protein